MDHIEYPKLFALLPLADVNPPEKRKPDYLLLVQPKPEAALAPLDTVDPPKKVNILTHHMNIVFYKLFIIFYILHTETDVVYTIKNTCM